MSKQLAKRYANALYMASRDTDQIHIVHSDMENFSFLFKEQPILHNYFKKLSNAPQIQKKIVDYLHDQLHLSPISIRLLSLLLERNRLVLLPQIATSFLEHYQSDQNIVQAEVISVRPLDKDEMDALTKKLENITGEETKILWKQDPSLLGGIMIRIGDFVLDGTLKARIRQVREHLMKA